MSLPETKDGCCTECGGNDMLLARDFTAYSPCEFTDGKWGTNGVDNQECQDENSVRFYCVQCGADHKVPEEMV